MFRVYVTIPKRGWNDYYYTVIPVEFGQYFKDLAEILGFKVEIIHPDSS